MSKNKMMKRTAKLVMVNALITSLVQTSFLSTAYALTGEELNSYTQPVLQVAGQYYNMRAQMLKETAMRNAMIAEQQRMQSMIPVPAPAKFFPECKIAPSISNFPANACTGITTQAQAVGSMMAYTNLAQSWTNYYEQNLNEASNATVPTGLACLNDKQKAMDTQLTEMVNRLSLLQDQFKKQKETFSANNKRLLEQMSTANDELFGASGKNNLELKTRDFAKYFSQACQAVIGKENLKNGSAVGLNGILQGISGTAKSANEFSLNKGSIEEDIRREAQRITNDINGRGVADFINSPTILQEIGAGKYKNIAQAAGKQIQDLATARARITKELSGLGYTPKEMDKNFSADMDEFMAGAEDFFKKKYVNDCVTGADKGIAIPVDEILKNLKQTGVNSGSAAKDYGVALKKILDSDEMMDQKMKEIEALNGLYPNITYTYKDSAQRRVTESPYNLFMKTIQACETKFTQSDTFSTSGSKGVSYQKQVERGKTALQELKNLNDTFASKVNAAVINQMLSCNGESYKPGEGSCNEGTMDSSSAGFCVAHASQCANQIQGCYAEADAQVQQRKAKMQALATNYNNNVKAMIEMANGFYNQQKAAIYNMTKLIQEKFPGTNFEIPSDMLIAMPEMSKDAFGVELAGNGDLKFLDGEGSLPGKIEKLKKMFQLQRDAVKNTISEYIGLQKAAMEKQRDRWEKLASDCKSNVEGSQKEMARMEQEAQKRQAKEDAETRKFCKKYDSIRQNPLGACGKAKDLAELSDAISARISPRALDMTEQYASACDGYMNESNEEAIDCSDLKGQEKKNCITRQTAQANRLSSNSSGGAGKVDPEQVLQKLCSKGKEDSDFLKRVASFLPKNKQSMLDDVKSMPDAIEKLDGEDAYFLSSVNDLIADNKGSDPTCAKIKGLSQKDPAIESKKNERKELAAKIESEKDTKELDKLKASARKLDAEIAEMGADQKAKVEKLNKALTALASIEQPLDQSSKEAKLAKLDDIGTRLGEQSSAMCDLQSNSNIAKSQSGLFDLPTGFDSKILGSSGVQK